MINHLLLAFPEKSSSIEISKHLEQSELVETWFQSPAHRPEIRSFNLTEITAKKQEELPKLVSIVDLADWLNI